MVEHMTVVIVIMVMSMVTVANLARAATIGTVIVIMAVARVAKANTTRVAPGTVEKLMIIIMMARPKNRQRDEDTYEQYSNNADDWHTELMKKVAMLARLITSTLLAVIGGMRVNQDGMLPNLSPRSLIGMTLNLNPRSLIGMIPNLLSLYTFLKRVGKVQVIIITKKVITLKMEESQARVNQSSMKKASLARVNLNIMNLNLGGVQDPSHYLIRMAVVIGLVVPSLSLNTCLVRVEKVKETSQARVNKKKASRARVNLNIMSLNLLIGGVQDPSQFIMMAVVTIMVPSLSIILNHFILNHFILMAVVIGMVMMVTGCMT